MANLDPIQIQSHFKRTQKKENQFEDVLTNGVQQFGSEIIDFASFMASPGQMSMPMMTALQFYVGW